MNKEVTVPSYADIIARAYYPYAYANYNQEHNKVQVANVTFQVTDSCNLKCNYCYQIQKHQHFMTLDVAKKFIDLLIENNDQTKQYIDTYCCDGLLIDFIGGEPLLVPNLIDNIIKYFRKRMIETNHPWQYNNRIMMTSNGTLYFNPDVQKFLKKYNDDLSLTISIDGNKELHDSCRKFPNGAGSYDLAIEASRHFRKNYNELLGCKMTLSPYNVQYTSDALINLINEGYKDIFFNCVHEEGWTYNHATILYNELKKLNNYILDNDLENSIYLSLYKEDNFMPYDKNFDLNWCGGNGQMIALDWKGDIYPCVRFMETSLGDDAPPIKIGNIYDGILPNKTCKSCIDLLKTVNRNNQTTEECQNCQIGETCSYCQAYNYQIHHSFFKRTTYNCCMTKASALGIHHYWNKLYLKHNENKRKHLYLPDEEALKIISLDELNMLKELEK